VGKKKKGNLGEEPQRTDHLGRIKGKLVHKPPKNRGGGNWILKKKREGIGDSWRQDQLCKKGESFYQAELSVPDMEPAGGEKGYERRKEPSIRKKGGGGGKKKLTKFQILNPFKLEKKGTDN